MRKILTLFALFCFAGTLFAQQDAMFSKYMFNSLTYNPAYAGAKDHMSIGLLHRTQWWGIDGAPTTQSFAIHTPLRNERVGVGFNVVNDNIGPTNNFGANVSYAYRIPMGETGKLSIGLQAGVENFRADWNELNLNPDQGPDVAFADNPNMWLPNFGAGIYYYTKYFYAGASVPHLVEYSLRDNANIETELYARQYRHYYFTLGGAMPLNGDDLVFKPSMLIKNIGLDRSLRKDEALQNVAAPTEFEVDLSLLFYEAFWIGASYRSSFQRFNGTSSDDSVDIWASYLLKNGLRIGAAYDYTITKLQQPARGSFEVMLGYEFDYETKKTVTPRYF